MEFHAVLNNSVPANGRKLTTAEWTRCSIVGVNSKRNAPVCIRQNGTMFVMDTVGREHSVGRRVDR